MSTTRVGNATTTTDAGARRSVRCSLLLAVKQMKRDGAMQGVSKAENGVLEGGEQGGGQMSDSLATSLAAVVL